MTAIGGISSFGAGASFFASINPAKHTAETDQFLASKGPNGTAVGANVDLADVQISAAAATASDMLDAANKYIQSNYLTSTVTYGADGYPSLSAYVDVKKYNDFLFDNAATQMVAVGAAQGITLDKDQLVQNLRQSNSTISSITDDNDVRNATLTVDGHHSGYSDLTASDRDALTDQFIAEKMAGGDGGNTEYAAAMLEGQRYETAVTGGAGYFPNPVTPAAVKDVSAAPDMNVVQQGVQLTRSDFGRAILSGMVQSGAVSADALVKTLAPSPSAQGTSTTVAPAGGAKSDVSMGK